MTGLFQMMFCRDGEPEVAAVKVAVTVVVAEMVTVQEAVPEQPPPLQPLKNEPGLGVAARVTAVPLV